MNSVETLMLNFIKSELTKNPQLAGNFLQHALSQSKIDPSLITDLVGLFDQLLPVILQNIKL